MVIDVIAAAVTVFFAASSGQTTITPKMTEFDLEKVHHKVSTCADRSPLDEIIVCAPKNMNIWISEADKARYAPKTNGRAETTLVDDLKGAAEVEKKEISPGMTSNRIMFRLKLPF